MTEGCNNNRSILKKLLYLWMTAALPIITVGGVSSYPLKFRYPAIVFSLIIFIFSLFLVNRKVSKDWMLGNFFIVLGVLFLSSLSSMDLNLSLSICLTYLCGVTLCCLELPKSVYEKTLKVMEIICLVIAATIILSVFIDDFVMTYLGKLVDPNGTGAVAVTLYEEINYSHSYSGLAREKAEAAYIMNVGLAIMLARIYSGKKVGIWGFIKLIIFALGLIFANKRMLFLVPFLCYIVFTIIQKKKGKLTKFLLSASIGISLFILLSEFIPQVNNIILRFTIDSGDDVLNGRDKLWIYSEQMFSDNPMFGRGFATFNEYAFRKGFLNRGGKWNYYGHNCYLELLGELGIIGSAIFWFAFIIPCLKCIKLLTDKRLDKDKRYLLLFSLYVQIMFLSYCLTGNAVYINQQIMLWLFAISIVFYVRRNRPEKKVENNKTEKPVAADDNKTEKPVAADEEKKEECND